MCLILRYVFHVIIIRLVAHLAVRVVLVRHRFWLWYRMFLIVMIGLNVSLSVFLGLFSTLLFNPFEVVLCELLLGQSHTRTVTNWHLLEEHMIVVRLLEFLLRKVHWINEFALG